MRMVSFLKMWVICHSVRQRLKLQLTLKAEAKIHKLATNLIHFSFSLKALAESLVLSSRLWQIAQ